MTFHRRTRLSWILAAVAMSLLTLPAFAAEVPNPLPDPDGKPADQSKPVQVFILLGQSNMLGFGRVGPADQQGTLEYMTKEKGKYAEFKGNVKTTESGPFWRKQDVSPSGQGYHYNHNAETYMEVGNALGRAMAELLEKK